jgi:hypothetical protein
VPTPLSTNIELIIKVKAGKTSHNLKLFIRGKDISGLFIIIGSIKLPNPPIIIGITIKKIIKKACKVTILL